MNKLFTQKQKLNTRWIYALGGEVMGSNNEAAQQRAEPVETPEAFIARHNDLLNQRIASIPCPDSVRDLCHGNVADLVTQASNPDFSANQNRLAAAIEAEVNAGEGAQFAAAEGNPNIQFEQQQVEGERAAREAALRDYLHQVAQAQREQARAARSEADGDSAKEAHARDLELRGNLMEAAGNMLASNGIDWTNEIPFNGGSEALVSQAKEHIGVQEGTAQADSLAGLDTDSIAWCGGGLEGLCNKAGIQIGGEANLNVAECWVKENGATGEHVAMCSGPGTMIGCNQDNAITECPMPGNYRVNTVANLEAGIFTDVRAENPNYQAQPGDIIVTSRGEGNSDPVSADQNVA